MSKIENVMHNLVVLMEPRKNDWDTPSKGGNLILNRFCIEEDAAFELSGVDSFKAFVPLVQPVSYEPGDFGRQLRPISNSKEKGKEYSLPGMKQHRTRVLEQYVV